MRQNPRPQSRFAVPRSLPPLAWGLGTLAIGLSLTAIAGLGSLRNRGRADQARIAQQAARVRSTLEGRFRGYEDILRGAAGFAMALPGRDPVRWAAYVDGLDLPGRHPGLKTLSFIQEFTGPVPISPEGVPLHAPMTLDETDRRLQGGSSLVITLAHPLLPGSRALWADLGTSAHQREAAERAFQGGAPALTGPLVFSQGGEQIPAMGLYQALSQPSGGPRTWVSVGIFLAPLIQPPEGSEEGLATEILDEDTGKRLGAALPAVAHPDLPDRIERIRIGGRSWRLCTRPLPAFFTARGRETPLMILLGGGLLSLSSAAALWSLATARRRAILRTRDLTRSFHANLQRYEALVRQTPIGVAEWNPRLELLALNPAGHRILGLELRPTRSSSGFRSRLPVGRRKDLKPMLEEVLREGRGLHRVLTQSLPEGGERHCEWTCFPILDEEGRVSHLIGLIQDVTERRREEEARIQQLRLESLSVLAGGVSHDFNNLLSIIQGHAELAAKSASPALAHHLNPILETT